MTSKLIEAGVAPFTIYEQTREAMAKPHQIGVRLAPDVKLRIEEAAATEHRTVSNLVEKIIIDWLAVRGAPPKTKSDANRTP